MNFDNNQFLSTVCYSTLVMIDKELTEIRKQNEWLQGLYTDLNMEAVEGCLDQLSAAHEKFTVCAAIIPNEADIHPS